MDKKRNFGIIESGGTSAFLIFAPDRKPFDAKKYHKTREDARQAIEQMEGNLIK